MREYYTALKQYSLLHATHEGAVKAAFGTLLQQCAKQFEWTVLGEYELPRHKQRSLRVDGALVDRWKLARGYWEAKDEHDDLAVEAKKKIALGYPTANILFQSPERAILYQNGKQVLDTPLTDPRALVDLLKGFFRYEPPAFAQWERAVEDFGDHVPKLAGALIELIEQERRDNRRFTAAFAKFLDVCRCSINPNLSEQAVEKMLVQHLLTERIFRKVFDNPDFARRNVIAIEIERVVDALTSRAFNRQKFLGELDRFYVAIEKTAATIADYTEKQHFLNTVYEEFFQRFDEKTADTHGIVYTPQSIVKFMVRSVDELLRTEFSSSLGDRDVHVIDPFVGTGNFLVHVMKQIPKTKLEHKYSAELHANEIMLLPYYIASMNIEHEYAELTGQYKSFDGMCLVDTFELSESEQVELGFISEVNSQRVEKQKRSPIFVVLGNPPYNAWQREEDAHNKNRKYPILDRRVAETYGRDSAATLKNSLSDPYVKAFRWAADRIGEEGIVAFVSNASYVSHLAFDGMRKNMGRDFDALYVLDLGGDVRKNPKLSGSTHNVFGIQVGVAISLLVRRKKPDNSKRAAAIWYAKTEPDARKEAKYAFLDQAGELSDIPWRQLQPDTSGTWLTDGLQSGFGALIPVMLEHRSRGASAQAIFGTYSNGLKSQRDAVVWNFSRAMLEANVGRFFSQYEECRRQLASAGKEMTIDSLSCAKDVKWSDTLRRHLARGAKATFDPNLVRAGIYRPFVAQYVYVGSVAVDRPGSTADYFSKENNDDNEALAIVVSDKGFRSPYSVLAVASVPELHLCASTDGYQVLPLKSVTAWALDQFRRNYSDDAIAKLDIFHYVYAVLHHPAYRNNYGANLKRELPRVPFVADFWGFADRGKRLVELHVGYEKQYEHELKRVETPGEKLNWRVAKMRLSKGREGVYYNNFLTLVGIPPEALEYKLGNRSALEWVIDQYQVSTDERSGITNDPNRADDPQYIVRLIGQVITVSLETMKIVKALPALDAEAVAVPESPTPPSGRTGPVKAKPSVRPLVAARPQKRVPVKTRAKR
ncbi:MAG TPA: type ISP restriction/modification enzyme [Polyangiaceae bacterium]|nr:type ISP restriction/modification enzyme [Polyangiaceae bacterium]